MLPAENRAICMYLYKVQLFHIVDGEEWVFEIDER